MNNLRLIASLCAGLGSASLIGCSADVQVDSPGPDSILHVENQSDFSVVTLQVAPVGTSTWGPNLLRNGALDPGDSIDLGVACDTYDARLIDETGVDCQLHDVDLCLNDADWIIRNETCVQFREAAAAAKVPGNTSTAGNTQDVGGR
jgi:hypothetical protein